MSEKTAGKPTVKKSKQRNNTNVKPGAYFETYADFFTGRQKPVPKRFLDQLSQDLLKWAFNDKNALILSQFFYARGIGDATFNPWRERDENFKQACEYARRIIGNRREIGAIKRKYEAGMIRTSMRLYNPEWEKLEDFRSEQRQKRNEKTTQNTIQWVLEKFPSSKLVPDKIEEDPEPKDVEEDNEL